jgi:hypothetical protein
VGFPTLQKLTQAFKNVDQVKFFAVQTVFEGHKYNSQDKLRKNQLEWDLKIPMAHAAGNPQTHEIPEIMRKYRSGGTPWKVIINPEGKVIFNQFHIKPSQAIALIESMLSKGKDSDVPITKPQSLFSSHEGVDLGNAKKD